MPDLRPYQSRAVAACRGLLDRPAARVCLVMPTGAGKSITAQAIAEGEDAIWLVHTTALRDQAPGRSVTVQSLLAGDRPRCSLLIADECHHLCGSAEAWKAVAADYPRILGLTATPARGDGAPLGEQFGHLVVGASYSELLRDGYLVPCRVVRPASVPEESGLADHPADAWRRWAGVRRGFAFFGRVETASRFSHMIPRSAVVHGEQPQADRQYTLDRFRRGSLDVLASVATLTEGVDLPTAEVCMLARGVSHAGAYLQAVGRVLRPAPGKTEALLIDLPGASFRFGLPTEDREYSLTGDPVRRDRGAPSLSQCLQCGAVYEAGPTCPRCGWVRPPKPPRVRIWGVDLVDAQTQEGLTPEQKAKLDWRMRMEGDPVARKAWYARVREDVRRKGWKPGAAVMRFKGVFGRYPGRGDV